MRSIDATPQHERSLAQALLSGYRRSVPFPWRSFQRYRLEGVACCRIGSVATLAAALQQLRSLVCRRCLEPQHHEHEQGRQGAGEGEGELVR